MGPDPQTMVLTPTDFELYGAGGPGAGGGYNTGGGAGGGGACSVYDLILRGPVIIGFKPAKAVLGGSYGQKPGALNRATIPTRLLLHDPDWNSSVTTDMLANSGNSGSVNPMYAGSGAGTTESPGQNDPRRTVLAFRSFPGSSGVNQAGGQPAGPDGPPNGYIPPGPGYPPGYAIGIGGYGDGVYAGGSGGGSYGGTGYSGGIYWWTY